MAITVANVKSFRGEGTYIGRAMPGREASVLGNPFHIGRDGTREQVIEKYLHWLRRQYRLGRWQVEQGVMNCPPGLVYIALHDLAKMHLSGQDVVLLCWCKPDPCHGDIVADAVEKIAAAIVSGAEKG